MKWLDFIIGDREHKKAQLMYISGQMTFAAIGNSLVSSILLITLINEHSPYLPGVWWLIFNILLLPRLFMARQYLKHRPDEERLISDALLYTVSSTIVTAIAWSTGFILFFNEESIYTITLLTLSAIGVSAGALGMQFVIPRLFAVFLLILLLPLIVLNITHDSIEIQSIGVLTAVLGGIIYSTCKKLYKYFMLSAEKEEDLIELTTQDPLTRTINRRGFEQQLQLEWRRAIRSGHPISLIIIDIDYFKKYNDHFGHSKGDECLRQVAQVLNKRLQRHGDFLCRIGGEEFAVILPNTDIHGARIFAEQLNLSVAAAKIPHAGDVSEFVTISLGASTAKPQKGDFVTVLFDTADQALYTAKHKGRNRVAAESSRMLNI